MYTFMLSYSQACEPHATVFHKILQALAITDLMNQVWKLWWSGRCSIWPVNVEAL